MPTEPTSKKIAALLVQFRYGKKPREETAVEMAGLAAETLGLEQEVERLRAALRLGSPMVGVDGLDQARDLQKRIVKCQAIAYKFYTSMAHVMTLDPGEAAVNFAALCLAHSERLLSDTGGTDG